MGKPALGNVTIKPIKNSPAVNFYLPFIIATLYLYTIHYNFIRRNSGLYIIQKLCNIIRSMS
jgi:hypothetical protein